MKILIAEDDPVTLDTLAACVRGEGFQAVLAGDGQTAFRLWQKERPQLVCLDIMLPGMDGFELCRRIRLEDETVPVLFLSAKNEEQDVVAGLRLGADDFLRKPFGKAELMARIQAALRRAAPTGAEQAAMFAFGPWRIFPGLLRAESGSAGVDLTPREVSLLQVLSKHAGRPVPRDVLLDACWGLEYFPESRTLDQHIATLRKKIEPDPARPALIETVRNIGYRHPVLWE